MPPAHSSPASFTTRAATLLLLTLAGCPQSQPRATTWDPSAAAHYLDKRANSWMHTRAASREHGTACLSCHTTVPYALVRSELGKQLNEPSPAPAQRELLAMVKKRVALWPQLVPWYRDEKPESRGTEAVLNALVLVNADAPSGQMGATTRAALDDMWALQRTEGPQTGSWPWINFGNEPWEAADSVYYGATLAALAIGLAPEGYRSQPDVQQRVGQMQDYLRREYHNQTLLNRIELLRAAGRYPSLIDPQTQASTLREITALQQADGGWSVASLMPNWKRHDGSSPPNTSDGYATGLITLVLEESGAPAADPRLSRGLAWLVGNQSHWNGRWSAESPNAKRHSWSFAGPFMDDAATAFAVLALTRMETKVAFASGQAPSALGENQSINR
jgi:squalene-hopene/tetraprenyl-beta-curcumene cyclase